MHFSNHPFWLVGFRPFFSLGCLSGMSLPILWVLVFSGVIEAPTANFTSVQWHAHEMFFGFGWAILGGFLLTSTKNWVNIRGYHGQALMFLVAAWVIERIGMAIGGSWPTALFLLSNNLFLGSIVVMLLWTLIRHRDTDSYRDNAFFLIMLPGFLVAKYQMLEGGDFTAGYGMAIALFRLAFLVMLERTLTGFMKAAFQTQILRHPLLDMSIKLLGLSLILEFALPRPLTAAISLLLATLLTIRFFYWKPRQAFQRLDIGVMYIGYLCIVAQLLIEALGHIITFVWIGSVSVHLFTFGAMGLVVPGMIIRISKGHTGRKVVFDGGDKLVLSVMLVALLCRVVIPQFAPTAYIGWIYLSAACWFIAFGTLAWRYVPMLLQPRIDGREH